MAIAVGNSVTLTGNGLGSWLKMGPGVNKVCVTAASWSGPTAALVVSIDGTDAKESPVRTTPNGTAISATTNEEFVVNGPGYVTCRIGSYSVPITVQTHQVRYVPGPV